MSDVISDGSISWVFSQNLGKIISNLENKLILLQLKKKVETKKNKPLENKLVGI